MTVATVPSPPVTHTHIIRPYNAATDKQAVYDVCRKTCDDGADGTEIFPVHTDLVADKFIGAYLQNSPEYCFVIEDCQGVCGYVLAALDAKTHLEYLETTWIPAMKDKYPRIEKTGEMTPAEEMIMSLHSHKNYMPADSILASYPSLVQMATFADRLVEGGLRLALASAVAALKTNGSQGIYAEVHVGDRNTIERYSRLGMLEQTRADARQPEELVLVARTT